MGYEAHAGGAAFGCVVLGSGDKYQILVYDGQKVPQLVTPLRAGFTYNLRDLYVSLTDSNGVNWSILFDSVESLYLVLKNSFSAATQVAGISESSDEMFKGMLPPVSVVGADDPVLGPGMFAGVYVTIFEMGEINSYPSFIMAETPFKQVTPPAEVVKVRIGADDDFLGGLSASLVGHKKGERFMIALPPMIAYKNGADKAELATKRVRPTTWLYAEVEVSKVKTEKKKEVVVDSAASSVPHPPAPPSNEPTSDLTARMARLAQQQGAGASIMPTSPGKVALEHVSPPQQHHHEVPPTQQHQQQSHTQTSLQEHFHQQSPPLVHQHQQQLPQQYQQHQQQYQSQQHISSPPPHDFGNQQQSHQHSPQQYALTVVNGQQAHSPYLAQPQNQSQQLYQHHHQQQQQQQQQQLNPPYQQQPPHVQLNHNNQSMHDQSLQQSMVGIQQSLVQLHTKFDMLSGNMGSGVIHQQMMLQNQQIMGMGNKGSTKNNGGDLKNRATEAVTQITALMEEYETGLLSASNDKDAEKIKKLEDKNEGLQEKVEKLMHEKMALLEKQQDGMHRESEIRQELSTLKASQGQNSKDSEDIEVIRTELKHSKSTISNLQSDIKEKEVLLKEREIALKEKDMEIMSMKDEVKQTKDAAATFTTEATIDLEGEQVQAYTNQKVLDAVEEALKKSTNEQREIVDDLSKQLDISKATIDEKNKEIGNLKENIASVSESSKPTEDSSEKVDVKKLMSTIYDRFRQKFPGDSEEEVKHAEILKAVRLILKQVAAESETTE